MLTPGQYNVVADSVGLLKRCVLRQNVRTQFAKQNLPLNCRLILSLELSDLLEVLSTLCAPSRVLVAFLSS
jgi:hypothetical protein